MATVQHINLTSSCSNFKRRLHFAWLWSPMADGGVHQLHHHQKLDYSFIVGEHRRSQRASSLRVSTCNSCWPSPCSLQRVVAKIKNRNRSVFSIRFRVPESTSTRSPQTESMKRRCRFRTLTTSTGTMPAWMLSPSRRSSSITGPFSQLQSNRHNTWKENSGGCFWRAPNRS